MNLDPLILIDYLQRAGTLGLLILIVVGGSRGLWVYGWYADELRARLIRAEEQRDHAQLTARQAIQVAEKVT